MATAAETFTAHDLAQALVKSFREVMEPAVGPRPELVTVGETSDPQLDVVAFCADCLGERGPRWNSHSVYWWGYDPERPDRPKRHSIKITHPDVRKALSYDQAAIKAGLDNGTHGKQCIQCGAKMRIAA